MNPLLISILTSALRMGLGGVATWLITVGAIDPSQETAFYTGIATALIGLYWIVQKSITAKRELNTAAGLDVPTSVDVIKQMVKNDVYADAVTPAGAVPNVQNPGDRL